MRLYGLTSLFEGCKANLNGEYTYLASKVFWIQATGVAVTANPVSTPNTSRKAAPVLAGSLKDIQVELLFQFWPSSIGKLGNI